MSAPGTAGGLNDQAEQGGANPPATPQSPAAAPGSSVAPATTPAPGSGTIAGATTPGRAGTSPAAPPAGTPGTPTTGPDNTRTATTTPTPTPAGINTPALGTLATDLAPAALQAGMTALEMLPMLASALDGSGTGTGTGTTGLSPQTQDAINILKQLQAIYGTGNTTGDTTTGTPTSLDTTNPDTTTGGSSTADAVQAHQLYQQNVANAFNAIDNTLAGDIHTFAGGHSVDQNQINALLTAVDNALAHIGSNALLTTTGEQQVVHILTTAITQAEKLAGNTNTNAQTTANDINALANQYLLILSGENPNATVGSTVSSVGGTVGQWIQEAAQVLQTAGITLTPSDEDAIAIIIEHESSGNPDAVNNSDVNAAAGNPSTGLMQITGSNFDSYALPGYTNIYDPVSNIVAGVRYAVSRYGSPSNVPGVVAVRAGKPYVPY